MSVKFDREKIINKREEMRLFPVDMADKLSISVGEYRDIESGLAIPNRKIVENICSILDLDIKDVFEDNIKETTMITIFNAKGGVGKTTSAGALASALAEKGLKVLCVDLDAQCNLTTGFEVKINEDKNIFKIFSSENPFKENARDYIISTKYENIDIISGSKRMSKVQSFLDNLSNKELVLFDVFKELRENVTYDFIIFDNAPSGSSVLHNALYTSNFALAPLVLSERFSLDGLNGLFDEVENCLRNNVLFKNLFIFVNKYDRRVVGIDDTLIELSKIYQDNLMSSIIRIDYQLEKSQRERKSIFEYNLKSKAVEDFRNLAEEIMTLR